MGYPEIAGTDRFVPPSPLAVSRSRSLDRYFYAVALLCSVTVGVAIRLYYVLRVDFPLNDGGLFYAMVRDLQRNGWLLPAFTSYNSANIPFDYSPLAFYVAGMIQSVTGASLVDVFRFLPVATNILTIVAFVFFARTVLASRAATAWAAFVFVLLPRSYEWLIMGGGLTRSFGLLFAILALQQAYMLYTSQDRKYLPLAIVFTGLTGLSHLETGWFLGVSLILFALAYGRNRDGLINTAILAIGAVAIMAPWLAVVISDHGLAPFLAAFAGRGSTLSGWLRIVQLEPFQQLLGLIAFLGIVACLGRGKFLFPIWLVAAFIFDSRSAATMDTFPLAMLAGIGLAELVMPVLAKANERLREGELPGWVQGIAGARGGLPYLQLATVGLAILSWQIYTIKATNEQDLLSALSPTERQAMQWVDVNTPSSSRFLVLTGELWWTDKRSEWFPVLANRVSVATVQGHEWLSDYDSQQSSYAAIQSCASRDGSCIDQWAKSYGASFDYIYAAKNGYTWAAIESLRTDPHYSLVYDGLGAAIFHRTG